MERRMSRLFSGCEEPPNLNINSVEKKLPKTNNSVPNFNYKDVFPNVNIGSPPKVVEEEQESPSEQNNLTESPK